MPSYSSNTERFDIISDWSIKLLSSCKHVFIEDYSYGSTGMVFHIAENCGLLKYKLHKHNIPFTLIAPSKIKKFATGKGNANKNIMYDTFKANEGVDLKGEFGTKTKNSMSPISDIIDSYYILKLGSKILGETPHVFKEV
jgi:hypothetical protein